MVRLLFFGSGVYTVSDDCVRLQDGKITVMASNKYNALFFGIPMTPEYLASGAVAFENSKDDPGFFPCDFASETEKVCLKDTCTVKLALRQPQDTLFLVASDASTIVSEGQHIHVEQASVHAREEATISCAWNVERLSVTAQHTSRVGGFHVLGEGDIRLHNTAQCTVSRKLAARVVRGEYGDLLDEGDLCPVKTKYVML